MRHGVRHTLPGVRHLLPQAVEEAFDGTAEFDERVVQALCALVERVLGELREATPLEQTDLAKLLVGIILTLDGLTYLGVMHSRIIPVGFRPAVGLLLNTLGERLQIIHSGLRRVTACQQQG